VPNRIYFIFLGTKWNFDWNVARIAPLNLIHYVTILYLELPVTVGIVVPEELLLPGAV